MSFFDPFNPSGSGPGESNLVRSTTPPSDTNKSWHNTATGELYTYDTDGWYSGIKQITDFNRNAVTNDNTPLKLNAVPLGLGREWSHVNATNAYAIERVYWSSDTVETGTWRFTKDGAQWFDVACNHTAEGNEEVSPRQEIASNEDMLVIWIADSTGSTSNVRFWIDYRLKYTGF